MHAITCASAWASVVVGHIDGGGAQAAQQRADLGAERLAQVAVGLDSGSSNSSRRGRPTMARASATRCLLAAGQLGRAAPGQRFQPDQRQRLGHPPGRSRAVARRAFPAESRRSAPRSCAAIVRSPGTPCPGRALRVDRGGGVERGLAADADAAGLRAQRPARALSSVLLPQPDGPAGPAPCRPARPGPRRRARCGRYRRGAGRARRCRAARFRGGRIQNRCRRRGSGRTGSCPVRRWRRTCRPAG